MKKIEGQFIIELNKNYRDQVKVFNVLKEQYGSSWDPSDGYDENHTLVVDPGVDEDDHPDCDNYDCDTFLYSYDSSFSGFKGFKRYTQKEFLEAVFLPDDINFKPERGERVLVSDDLKRNRKESIFIADLGNTDSPICCVYPTDNDINEYLGGGFYDTQCYEYVFRIPGIKYKCDEKSNSISVSGSISGTPANIIQPGSSYSGLPVNRRRVLG